MRRFDYVEYKKHPYVLSEIEGDKATISGVFENYGCLCTTEIDVNIHDIKPTTINFDNCILGRLKTFRMIYDTIFGFAEEELSRIHSFS